MAFLLLFAADKMCDVMYEEMLTAGAAARIAYDNNFLEYHKKEQPFTEEITKKQATLLRSLHYPLSGLKAIAMKFSNEPNTLYISFKGAKESHDIKLLWQFLKQKITQCFYGYNSASQLNQNVSYSVEFVKSSILLAKKEGNISKLVISGHSLGGYYAQQVIAHLENLPIKNLSISGHAFQAPGAYYDLSQQHRSLNYPLFIYLRKGDICNIFKHLGKVVLYPDTHKWFYFSTHAHRLKPFLEELIKKRIAPLGRVNNQ